MNAPTDWVSAIAILAAGLILGMMFVFFFNRRKKTFGEDLALKDLQAKRDALVQQLRDPGLEPDERTRLELETARVLRELDAYQLTSAPAGETAPQSSSTAMNPTVKGFIWGASSVGALAVLFFLVMQQSAPREEGGSVTGGIESGQQAQMPQTDPQLEAAVAKDPNNLELRNDIAQAYLERENLMAVFQHTQFVLEKSPNDSRALTYQGLVRMAMGEGDEAMQMLQRATQSNAKNLDAWVALAWLYARADRMPEAQRMIAEASKQSPGDSARLEQVFAQMQQQIQMEKSQPAQNAQGGGMPQGHPPIEGAPAPAAAGAAGEKSIQVTLDVDPAAQQKSGVVFVMARNPAGGPPVAVKRMQVAQFPVTFSFGSADSMMGQPLPDKFRLEARLDSDGDAMTKPPTDPTAMQAEVVVGSNVKLALK